MKTNNYYGSTSRIIDPPAQLRFKELLADVQDAMEVISRLHALRRHIREKLIRNTLRKY